VTCFVAAIQEQPLRCRLFFAAMVALTGVKLVANMSLLTEDFPFGVFEWMHLAYSLGDIVLCLWVLVVVAIEIKKRCHRDWLHWVGVVTFAVSQCSYLIWTIGVSFL
jgi:hypothetical protein